MSLTTSDIQFVAQMLRRTREGDQVTRAESHRLDEIADHGHTKGDPVPAIAVPSIVNPSDGSQL